MDSKRFFLDKLIEENPNTPNLKKLETTDFSLSDIETIPERISNGERINSRVRLITNGSNGWIGSRSILFRREDAKDIPEQYRWYPRENLPATCNEILEYVFESLNLPYDSEWVNGGGSQIIKDTTHSFGTGFNLKKSLFFTGSIVIRIYDNRIPIDYIENNEIEAFTPLLLDNDSRTHLTPYSFEFFNKMSTVKGWDKIPSINSQESLNANLALVLKIISDLSKEEWTNEANPASPRPGGYFKFVHNGELNRDIINSIFGQNVMLPINMKYQHALILHLDIPSNSLSKYVGYLFIYWI